MSEGPACRFCGRPAKVADWTIGELPLYDCGEWCMFDPSLQRECEQA